MARRSILAAILISASLFLAAGCGGDSTPPPPRTGWVADTVRMGARADFRSLDPAIANDTDSIPFERMIFQPLLEYDDGSRLVPLLAEDVPEMMLREPDGVAVSRPALAADVVGLSAAPAGPAAFLPTWPLLRITPTYTFHLKKGVKFSNGREATADDFIYAWTRILDPATKSPGSTYVADRIVGAQAYIDWKSVQDKRRAGTALTDDEQQTPAADGVSGLRAPDPYTLEVRLNKPDPTFLYVIAMTYFAPVPREEIEKYPVEDRNDEFAIHPVGTGPFVLKEWRRSLRLRLERDPHYWGPNPPALKALQVQFGLDDLTMQMMFERGELDLMEQIPSAAYVRLKNDPRWQPYFERLVFNGEYFLNLNYEMEPFNGPNGAKVRQAFCCAIDKDRLVHVSNDRYVAAKGVVPPALLGDEAVVQGWAYDPERAKRLLAEAGYPNGLPGSLNLWVSNERSTLPRMAEVIQQDLARVGVQVVVNPVNFDAFQDATGKRKNVALSISGWYQDFPDASDFLDQLFSSGSIADTDSNNLTFYQSERADRLMGAADVEWDPVRRLQLYAEAEKVIVDDDAAVVPLLDSQEVWLRQPWVSGFRIHPVWLVRYEKLSITPP